MNVKPAPVITKDEINAIVDHAQKAPLENMRHGAAMSDLLVRFKAWAVYQLERDKDAPVCESGD